MSFAAKGEKNAQSESKTNTSHCPTKTISKSDTSPLKGIVNKKIDIFFKLAPHLWTYELHGQGEKKDVLQNLSPITLRTPLENLLGHNNQKRDRTGYLSEKILQLGREAEICIAAHYHIRVISIAITKKLTESGHCIQQMRMKVIPLL